MDLHHDPGALRDADTSSQGEHLRRRSRYPSAQTSEPEKKASATETRISRTVAALERCRLVEFIDEEQDVVNNGSIAWKHFVSANVHIRCRVYGHGKAAIHIGAPRLKRVTGRRLKHRVRCARAPGVWKLQRLRQIAGVAFLGTIVDPL